MTEITESNRTIAQTAADVFDGEPRLHRFYDDDRKSHVDILQCADVPEKGVTSYSTVGLSDAPLFLDGEEYPTRLELVGACASEFENFANVLATSAFNVINTHWFCAPGMIYPEVFAMYQPEGPMRHVLFVPPFLWEDLRTLTLPDKTVAWLLAIPISEAEMQFAEEHGPDKLEDLFVEKQIDIYDFERLSVL